MTFWVGLFRGAWPLICCLALGGCLPATQSRLDEEKEPHFLQGKSRVNALDFKGGIEAYEQALQVNPHSASAHFELGLLYEKNKQDFAAAIYHFDRFLELRPKSDYAEIVTQRIVVCKQELAKTVSLGPLTAAMQREFEQLTDENKRLRDELEKCRAYYAAHPPVPTNAPAPVMIQPRASQATNSRLIAGANATLAESTGSIRQPTTPTSAARTHTVKAGETPFAIARKYGIRIDALMAANPNLDARRLHIGQALMLPTP
jgi:LysM repeat protein